jgi:methylmalonyl-CoA/ethylmalonyl-CoA epimerase
MLPENYILHHIGYVTADIKQTANIFIFLGYKSGEVFHDTIQKAFISFLEKPDSPNIELVQPENEKSSLNKLLTNHDGASIYHVCYQVPDINEAYEQLTELGFIPLFRPVNAVAMQNKLICYFFHKEIGYIEIVNE